MIFKLFHLESYLGSSEETRSPNARSGNARGRTHPLASIGTQARTSQAGRAHGCPGDQLSSAFWVPRHCWGPGPRRGRWPGEGRTRLGPAQRYPAPVSYLLPAPSTTALVPPRHSLHNTPGGRKFFPPFFFIPGAAQAQGLLQACEPRRGRLQLQLQPPPLPEPSPAFQALGPTPKSCLAQKLPGPWEPSPPPLRPARHPKSPNLTRLLPAAAPLRPRPDAQRAQGRGWVQEG